MTFTGLRKLVIIGRAARHSILIRMAQLFDELLEKENDDLQGYYIDLNRSGLNDDDLGSVCEIPKIRSLKLARNNLTDKGISRLSSHPELEILWIGGEDVSGTSLEQVARLKNLEMLWVTDSPIHDADLDVLSSTRNLRS